MSGRWGSAIDRAIARGEAPSRDLIDRLTEPQSPLLGSDGLRTERAALVEQVLGAGPLEAQLTDPDVTDVLVNGDGRVWVDRGEGLVEVGRPLPAAHLRPLATRLAGLARRRLDDAQPWVDGLLPGGVRLHAMLPPLAEGGAHISLRIPRHQPVGCAGLEALGAVGPELADLLARLVRAKVSFVVIGGTGAGKTTVLGALLAECAAHERLVVVEDVRELDPAHPHVVRLQGRGANVEGVGAVTLVDLVRQSLRMRPDRLVVGEVRGAEVREMLAALNTGHDGGASTLHANSPADVPARLEALGALAGLGRAALHAQLRGALSAVVQVSRLGPRRLVTGIAVLEPTARGEVEARPAVTWDGRRLHHDSGYAALRSLLGGEAP